MQAHEISVKLFCSSCLRKIECGKNYFGTNYFLAPHPSDPNYTFKCKKCESSPSLIHLTKSWAEIALCVLTTFEMLLGKKLYWRSDIESFLESHSKQLAIGKDIQGSWATEFRHHMACCKLIASATTGRTNKRICYYLAGNHVPTCEAIFPPERILLTKEEESGKRIYFIKWVGFSEKYSTWETMENVESVAKANSISFHTLLKTYQKTREHIIDLDEHSAHQGKSVEEEIEDSMNASEQQSITKTLRRKRKLEISDESPLEHETTETAKEIEKAPNKSKNKKKGGKKATKNNEENRNEIEENTKEPEKHAIMEPERIEGIPLVDYTYMVTCSTCMNSIPLTDFGDDMISPTCKGITAKCGTCTKSAPRVVNYGGVGLSQLTPRALFALHVRYPEKEYFTGNQIAAHMLANPKVFVLADCRKLTEVNVMKAHNKFIKQLGNGKRQYNFAEANQALIKISFEYTPAVQKGNKKFQRASWQYIKNLRKTPNQTIPETQPPPPPSPSPSPPPSPPAQLMETLNTPSNALIISSLPSVPQAASENKADIFIGWMGEADIFAFVRIELTATLKDLRTTINTLHLAETGNFGFMYKKAPVNISQEDAMKVNECAIEKDDGLHLFLKRVARSSSTNGPEFLQCV